MHFKLQFVIVVSAFFTVSIAENLSFWGCFLNSPQPPFPYSLNPKLIRPLLAKSLSAGLMAPKIPILLLPYCYAFVGIRVNFFVA